MSRYWRVRLRVGKHRKEIMDRWIEERTIYAKTRDDAIAIVAGETDALYVHGCESAKTDHGTAEEVVDESEVWHDHY